MDNNTRLENIFNKALKVAEGIVNDDAWCSSMEALSALERLMNVAEIANDLRTSRGSSANVEFEGGRTMPGFNAHVMPL